MPLTIVFVLAASLYLREQKEKARSMCVAKVVESRAAFQFSFLPPDIHPSPVSREFPLSEGFREYDRGHLAPSRTIKAYIRPSDVSLISSEVSNSLSRL